MAMPLRTLPEPTTRSQIRLSYTDEDGSVFVNAEKGDRFLLTVQEAVIACGAFYKMAEFQTQMRRLMDRLGEWVDERRSKIKETYLTVRGSGLFYLVVTKDNHFDDELESALTNLDIEVANDDDFSLLKVEVLAIPNSPEECIKAFLGPVPLEKPHA